MLVGNRGLTHCGLIRAIGSILVCSFACCIWSECSLAEIHQVQAVPLLDTQLLGQLICHIANNVIEFTLDFSRDVMGEVADEGADRGGRWSGS